MQIYLVIATKGQNTTGSHLHIMRPFSIGNGRWWEKIDWPSHVLGQGKTNHGTHRLLLVSTSFPHLETLC